LPKPGPQSNSHHNFQKSAIANNLEHFKVVATSLRSRKIKKKPCHHTRNATAQVIFTSARTAKMSAMDGFVNFVGRPLRSLARRTDADCLLTLTRTAEAEPISCVTDEVSCIRTETQTVCGVSSSDMKVTCERRGLERVEEDCSSVNF
jgi:hypothetical protein